MKMLTKRIGPTILLLGFCVSSPHLFGAVITSGSINLPSFIDNGTFTLSGTGLTVAGSFNGPAFTSWQVIDSCYPACTPGVSLPVDGQVAGIDFRGGTATTGATLYPSVTWGDLLGATGSAFMITGPTITLNLGPGTYTGSFSFTGFLCGTTSEGPEPHPCTVDLLGLTGSGQVTVTILPNAGNLLRSGAATYTFTSVPEPSGIVLVGTAALILLGRRRRRSMRLV